MELDAAIFGTNDDLVVETADDECRSEREVGRVTADNLALTEMFEAFASDSSRMVQGWKLKDRGHQVGDRSEGSTCGQFRAVPLADRFESGVDIGLLREVFESVRISDPQPKPDLTCSRKSIRFEWRPISYRVSISSLSTESSSAMNPSTIRPSDVGAVSAVLIR